MFEHTLSVVEQARERRAFSAVAVEVGTVSGARWRHGSGRVTFDAASAAVTSDTVFDLASLTKVLATTTIAAALVDRGALDLSTPLARLVPGWSSADRSVVTVRDLLEHSSGLPGHRPYFRELTGRALYQAAIAAEPLEYPPRTRSIYSDLGFMLLGFILEDAARMPLDRQFDQWRERAGIDQPLRYRPPAEWWPAIAATEHDQWRGRVLQGEVHDENAAALGGVAAHAGLFGTAGAVGSAARWWMQRLQGSPDPGAGISTATAALFVQRSAVPGSSRALGWDTMLTTSSCGTRLSTRAIGHTGFTGTSLWIDPAQDFYAVLLTNRVHPTRDNPAIQEVRRAFHDAAVDDFCKTTQ